MATKHKQTAWDNVDQASLESFPASDPPAWNSSHAAASESTACPDVAVAGSGNAKLLKGIAIGAAAAIAITGIVFGVRFLRAR